MSVLVPVIPFDPNIAPVNNGVALPTINTERDSRNISFNDSWPTIKLGDGQYTTIKPHLLIMPITVAPCLMSTPTVLDHTKGEPRTAE